MARGHVRVYCHADERGLFCTYQHDEYMMIAVCWMDSFVGSNGVEQLSTAVQ
jgi:hypothetical protein